MVQQFCLKAPDTHTGERQEGEGKAGRQPCRKKPTYTVAGNLLGIQDLTVKAAEVAPHRHLLVSMEIRRLNWSWAHQHFGGSGLYHFGITQHLCA